MKNYKLLEYRVKSGMTQKEVSKAIGGNIEAYGRIERGSHNGTLETWSKIQKIFNIPSNEMWECIQCGKSEQ